MNRANRMMNRLLATVLLAVGVMFLTAGLLSYAPSTIGDTHATGPSADGDPRIEPTAGPSAVPSATPVPGTMPPPSATPGQVSPTPLSVTPAPSPGIAARATRIRISALEIDLPVVPGDLVVPGNENFYPLCDVAMYLLDFVQPGQEGTTYIYAHAQRGMFAPLLRASRVDDGAAMLGALVEVYTADAMLHLYEIDRVKRHATDLSLTETPPGVHQLVLQTSEGPSGTVPKLQVAARVLSVVPADPVEALPSPAPRVCGP